MQSYLVLSVYSNSLVLIPLSDHLFEQVCNVECVHAPSSYHDILANFVDAVTVAAGAAAAKGVVVVGDGEAAAAADA